MSLTMDAAVRHLLAYDYYDQSRVTAINLGSGRQASVSVPNLVLEGALTTIAW